MRNRRVVPFTILLLGAAVYPRTLPGQGFPGDSGTLPAGASPLASRSAPTTIRWYHAAAAAGGLALAALADQSLREALQQHRTAGRNDLARVARTFGEAEIFGTVALGTVAVGLLAGNGRVARAGGRITAGLLVAGTTSSVLKVAVGRARPSGDTTRAFSFQPFGGRTSWPSGHTTMAFALAAAVGDEIGSPPATVGLYAAATLTGWSRLNDDRHWLSDVLGGALIGVTAAKLMNGRWRVFGLSAPRFLLGPDRAEVSWAF